MKKSLLLVFVLMMISCVSSALAHSSGNRVIKVGYVDAMPFVDMRHKVPEGLAIDLWVYISRVMNNQPYELFNAGKNFDSALKELQAGQYDVLIGNISMSAKRLGWVDFTAPYLLNKTALVVVDTERSHGFFNYLHRMIFGDFGFYFLIIFFMIFMLSFLHWFFQRKTYKKCDKSTAESVETSFWVSIGAFISGELPDPESPSNFFSRLISIIGCCLGVIFVGLLGATFTTSLIRSEHALDSYYTTPMLKHKKILVLTGSIQTEYVKEIGAIPVDIDSVTEGYEALIKHPETYTGFALDFAMAKHTLHTVPGANFEIVSTFLGADMLAFSVPFNSPYKKEIDAAILSAAESGVINDLCLKYITDDSVACKLTSL